MIQAVFNIEPSFSQSKYSQRMPSECAMSFMNQRTQEGCCSHVGENPGPSRKAVQFAIARSWYRAQKPLKPGKTEKKNKQKTSRNSPGRAPNIQKKQRNTKTGAVFVFFLYFFRIFGAQPGVGNLVSFCWGGVSFRISGLEGFLSSIPGMRNRKV